MEVVCKSSIHVRSAELNYDNVGDTYLMSSTSKTCQQYSGRFIRFELNPHDSTPFKSFLEDFSYITSILVLRFGIKRFRSFLRNYSIAHAKVQKWIFDAQFLGNKFEFGIIRNDFWSSTSYSDWNFVRWVQKARNSAQQYFNLQWFSNCHHFQVFDFQ